MIPTYNQGRYISEAIDSVLSQTYKNIEIIVGDDASTDDTPVLIGQYLNHANIKIIRNLENIGRVENYRNLLNKHATGDLIINLDGDDFFTNDHFIALAVQKFEENPRAVIVAGLVRNTGRGPDKLSELPPYNFMAGIDFLKRLTLRGYYLMHMGVVYDAHKARNIDFYRSYATSSDLESLYRLLYMGDIEFIHEEVGVWRLHDNNASSKVLLSKSLCNLRIWDSVFSPLNQRRQYKFSLNFHRAKVKSYFASQNFIEISRQSKQLALIFILRYFKSDIFSTVLFLANPKNYLRVFFGLLSPYDPKISK